MIWARGIVATGSVYGRDTMLGHVRGNIGAQLGLEKIKRLGAWLKLGWGLGHNFCEAASINLVIQFLRIV